MSSVIQWVLENMSLSTLILALVLGFLGTRGKKSGAESKWEPMVFWLMLLFVGLNGLYTGGMHMFLPGATAAAIGWAPSPFQWEVAVADGTLGILGVAAAFASRPFRWAVIWSLALFYWGDAVGHVRQMELHDNFASGNAGSWFWVDVLGPMVLLAAQALNRSGGR